MKHHGNVIIIGSGLIGLSVARELAGLGLHVTLLERGRVGHEASRAAAGMLAAQAECDQPDAFFQLALKSRNMYPDWIRELEQEVQTSTGYRQSGILLVATNEHEARTYEQRAAWQREWGLRAEWIEPAELAAFEPGLAANLAGGLHVPDDHQIDSWRLCQALWQSAVIRGVEVHENCPVHSLRIENGRVRGVRTVHGDFSAEHVLVAAGSWSGQLLSGERTIPVRPVRGQVLEAYAPPNFLKHVIFSEGCYLVPKSEGRLLIGATVEEAGFVKEAELGGLRRLLERAAALVPEVDRLRAGPVHVGFRPATPDLRPVLGPDATVENLWWACGHYRNGVLLTPVTGKIMAQWIVGQTPEVNIQLFGPQRFLNQQQKPAAAGSPTG